MLLGKLEKKKKVSLTLVSFGGWFPVLCANYRQTDLPFLVNVGVVDLRLESDLRGLERVFRRETDLDPERPFVIWRVILKKSNFFCFLHHYTS